MFQMKYKALWEALESGGSALTIFVSQNIFRCLMSVEGFKPGNHLNEL